MRTDAKIGLIVLFAVILGVVIYFVAQTGQGRETQAATPGSVPRGLGSGGTGVPIGAAPVAPPTADGPLTVLAQAGTPDATPRPIAPPSNTPNVTGTPSGSALASAGGAHPGTPGGAVIGTGATGGGTGSTGSIIPPGMGSGSSGFGTGIPSGGQSYGSGSSGTAYGTGGVASGAGSSGSIDFDRPRPTGSSATPGNTGNTARAGTGATGPTTSYTIQKGDNFSTLAKKFGVSVKAIEAANPGVDSTKLQVNKPINIPAAGTGVSTASHTGTGTGTTAGTAGKAGGTGTGTTANTGTTPKAGGTSTVVRHGGQGTGGATASGGTGTGTGVGTATVSATPKPGTEYKVQKGDNLTKIAKEAYGSATKTQVQKIVDANRNELADANSVREGVVIKLP